MLSTQAQALTQTQPAPVAIPAAPARYFWTTAEVRLLQEHYPRGGGPACLDVLPGRELRGIYAKARKLGLSRAGRQDRRTYQTTDWIDAQIKKLYSGGDCQRGAVADLAKRLGRPRNWVTRRALALGLIRPRYKPAPWSAEELAILEEHETLTPGALRARLARAGFKRSESAIVVKRKRLGLRVHEDPDVFTARALATAMGVEAHKVLRWIEHGRLKAKRRGTRREQGDEWEIQRKHVRAFLVSHLADWDHRRCEQLWLVEMLAGTVGGAE